VGSLVKKVMLYREAARMRLKNSERSWRNLQRNLARKRLSIAEESAARRAFWESIYRDKQTVSAATMGEQGPLFAKEEE
jgi:hypothetical protein